MTMMTHKLVRLRGDEEWERIGEDWERHLEEVCYLWFVRDWIGPLASVSETREQRQLDWGATLYEVTKAELLDLIIKPRPTHGEVEPAWDRQHARLAALPDDGKYGVVWIECY